MPNLVCLEYFRVLLTVEFQYVEVGNGAGRVYVDRECSTQCVDKDPYNTTDGTGKEESLTAYFLYFPHSEWSTFRIGYPLFIPIFDMHCYVFMFSLYRINILA